MTIYLGTYTGKGSEGIYRAEFDARDGTIGDVVPAARVTHPSFLTVRGGSLAAVTEDGWGDGQCGSVSLFTINADRSLTLSGSASSGGRGPCHLSLLDDAVWVANYGNGVVARLPIVAGKLREPDFVDPHEGKGPHPKRQERTHAHCAVVDPAGRFVVSADLGNDTLYVYSVRSARGVAVARTSPGAGPRLVAFSRDGRRMFLVHELTGEIARYDVDPASGTFTHRQTVSVVPPGVNGEPSGAHVAVHPSGRFLFASERASNTLATMALAPDGSVELVATTRAGGRTPRFFALSPDGRWMIVAHQSSATLQVFAVDAISGALTPAGAPVSVSSPTCVAFAP